MRETEEMNMRKLCLALLLAVLLLCAASLACADTPAAVAEKGTGITVIPASQWAETFPEVYASYEANAENAEVVEYT
jgi:opacity protein-like surface antigen